MVRIGQQQPIELLVAERLERGPDVAQHDSGLGGHLARQLGVVRVAVLEHGARGQDVPAQRAVVRRQDDVAGAEHAATVDHLDQVRDERSLRYARHAAVGLPAVAVVQAELDGEKVGLRFLNVARVALEAHAGRLPRDPAVD